jgi:hypothetical protein
LGWSQLDVGVAGLRFLAAALLLHPNGDRADREARITSSYATSWACSAAAKLRRLESNGTECICECHHLGFFSGYMLRRVES